MMLGLPKQTSQSDTAQGLVVVLHGIWALHKHTGAQQQAKADCW